jgi:hypothetical protein
MFTNPRGEGNWDRIFSCVSSDEEENTNDRQLGHIKVVSNTKAATLCLLHGQETGTQ